MALVSKRHFHDVDVQMIYVLKGWIKSEFEGQGEVTMREGAAWLQPPRTKRTVLDYSDDCEMLEIILPAEFKTVEVWSPCLETLDKRRSAGGHGHRSAIPRPSSRSASAWVRKSIPWSVLKWYFTQNF